MPSSQLVLPIPTQSIAFSRPPQESITVTFGDHNINENSAEIPEGSIRKSAISNNYQDYGFIHEGITLSKEKNPNLKSTFQDKKSGYFAKDEQME